MRRLISFTPVPRRSNKSFLLILILQVGLLPLFFSSADAQVYNGTLALQTQADVDGFQYTSVTGNLLIGGLFSNITNLDGLSELTSVGGDLILNPTLALSSISGLSSLTSVGGDLELHGNIFLTSIDGLSHLSSVGGLLTLDKWGISNLDALGALHTVGGLKLEQNINLINVDGLSNLTASTISGSVTVNNNNVLDNLNGLSSVHAVGQDLLVTTNPLLSNVDGLSHLTSVARDLKITESPALTNVDGLSALTGVGRDLFIDEDKSLTNVYGLSNITSVGGGLDITTDDALANIDGLSNLTTVSGDLNISGDPVTNLNALSNLTTLSGSLILSGDESLTDIGGLSNLTAIGGGVLILTVNALTNVDGFSNLTSVGKNLSIVSNFSITNLDGLANLTSVGTELDVRQNTNLKDFCGLYKLFNSGTIGGPIFITDNGANTVDAVPPANLTVNADQGLCSAVVSNATIGTATSNGCLVPITFSHSDFPAGNVFPVGVTNITWSATDAANNTATVVQTITVVDNQPPTISCPANVTVSCANDIPAVNISSVTASDNCSAVVTHVSDETTNKTCANRFTLTRTYRATDPAGNFATCSQVITVYDNVPPQISGLSTSQTVLWPPNHTMRDITVNYTATDNCSDATTTVTVTSNEPVNGTADGDTDPDWVIVDSHHIQLRAERAANGTGRIYTITVTINDGCNAPVSASTQVMVVHNITGPVSGKPFIIGSTVNFSGEFWDKPTNRHTGKWLIDDNTSVKGSITEPTATRNGKATGSYKFTNTGVYKLQMNIIDQNGITSYANTNGDIEEIVVIYDPNGGYAYGGGWFNSSAGALISDKTATGKVSYGFSVNYYKGATYPKGEARFEFKLGGMQYDALNFDYLSVSGYKAVFAGSGKINGGQSGINFTMYVIDGALDGTGVDKVRIKIYNKNTGYIYYDNEPGSSYAADPATPVGTNSSVVITGTPILTSQKPVVHPERGNMLEARAIPNPTNTSFTVHVESDNLKDIIRMQVIDMYGRIIEVRNVAAGATIQLGDKYRPGSYIAKFIQGEKHKELELVKLSN